MWVPRPNFRDAHDPARERTLRALAPRADPVRASGFNSLRLHFAKDLLDPWTNWLVVQSYVVGVAGP